MPETSQPSDVVGMLMRIAPALARLQNEMLGAMETRLTFRQFRLLRLVARGHDYPTSLQEVTTLSLATISASVDALVGRGLLGRERNTTDRRRVTLRVTDAGGQAINQGQQAMADLAQVLTGVLAEHGDVPVHEGLRHVLRRVEVLLTAE
jgi:DNA-binding MarR family transcriptional regulator